MKLRSRKINQQKENKIINKALTPKRTEIQKTRQTTTPTQLHHHRPQTHIATVAAEKRANNETDTDNEITVLLQKLFSNPKFKTSYSRYLKRFFQNDSTLSKFRPVRRRFKRRRTKVIGPFNTYQMDIIDYRSYRSINRGYQYILVIIDAFSRFAFCYKLKKKDAVHTAKAIQHFLGILDTIPKFVYTDAGKYFLNSRVQQLFIDRGIAHFVLKYGHKASIAERFNRTLKESIELYFNKNSTRRWIEVLRKLVNNYNNKYHTSIKMPPAEVNRQNFRRVYKNLYPRNSIRQLCKFKKGDFVRIAIKKGDFEKGYSQRFSDEIYKISSVIQTNTVCYYKVRDLEKSKTLTKYYHELTLVRPAANTNSA